MCPLFCINTNYLIIGKLPQILRRKYGKCTICCTCTSYFPKTFKMLHSKINEDPESLRGICGSLRFPHRVVRITYEGELCSFQERHEARCCWCYWCCCCCWHGPALEHVISSTPFPVAPNHPLLPDLQSTLLASLVMHSARGMTGF